MQNMPESATVRAELEQLRAELAALREPMACGHPRACWIEDSLTIQEIYEVEANHPPLIGHTGRQHKAEECPADCPCRKGHCTACARDHLRVAAEKILQMADRSALDAALKKAEHKGFCEALHRIESSIRDPESGGDLLIMQALDAHDAEVRERAALDEHDQLCIPCFNAVRAKSESQRCGRGLAMASRVARGVGAIRALKTGGSK